MRSEIKIVFDRTKIVGDEARRRTGELVRKTAFEIEAGAKEKAPVDTGFLRNSIQADVSRADRDLEADVVVGAEYAPHQEFGTRFQPGQPYLIPTVDEVRPKFEQGLQEIIPDK